MLLWVFDIYMNEIKQIWSYWQKKMHTDNKQIILHGAWYRINVL